MQGKINFKGIDLEISYEYEHGSVGDYNNPPEPSYFEIFKVVVGDVDITDLLDEKIINQIEEEYCNENQD